ncbi:GGDEF domain-containing protein [Dyella sp.]|uniref:GGDEF domain-containing protein n=1 Tax=Dyella sp. TaxID=1869338 RepID=UPI002ED68C36
MDQEHWGQRYQQALQSLDEQERVSAEREAALRRLVARVAMFGVGRHGVSDALLGRIRLAMRATVSHEEIEAFLGDSVDAIAHIDEVQPSVVVEAASAVPASSPNGHEALAGALQDIELSPALGDMARLLRESLADWQSDVMQNARELAGLVNRQGRLLRDDIEGLQGVLQSVGSRLEDIRSYIDTEVTEQQACANESHVWDKLVRDEMRDLGERSAQAVDLAGLRALVTTRVESIDKHLRSYREREVQRYAGYMQRADEMRRRVEELEFQASSLKDSLEREHERASTDPLTGIPNRLAYEMRVEEAWRQWVLDGRPLCVAALDIDHFKRINDTLGHAAGDAVLKVVGQTLQQQADERLFVCRYGGEEFVLVFIDTSLDEAMRRGEALRVMIEKLSFRASGKPVPVTLSGGFASFTPGDTPAQALARADRALYAAKDAGRNRLMA